MYYYSAKTLPLLNKVVWFNPWRFPSSMLDKVHLSECLLTVLCCWISWLSSSSFADFSYPQLGRRGVWDSSHYTSTWDGVWSGPNGSGLTFPSNARATSSTQGSLNPSVPPSEPRSALYYHLTQHDGPGRDVCQQWPTYGEHCNAHTPPVNQEVIYFLQPEKCHPHLSTHSNPVLVLLQ